MVRMFVAGQGSLNHSRWKRSKVAATLDASPALNRPPPSRTKSALSVPDRRLSIRAFTARSNAWP